MHSHSVSITWNEIIIHPSELRKLGKSFCPLGTVAGECRILPVIIIIIIT